MLINNLGEEIRSMISKISSFADRKYGVKVCSKKLLKHVLTVELLRPVLHMFFTDS